MKPNVLFILLDAVSADKFYGNKKTSVTPNIDSLIKKGTYFSQAITTAPSTIPSVASLLTSLYAFECVIKDKNMFTMNQKVKSHIQNFADYGYHTHATFQDVIIFLGLGKIFENAEPYPVSLKLWNGLGQITIDKLHSKDFKEPWFYYLHVYDLGNTGDPIEQRIRDGSPEIRDKKFGSNYYERTISAMDVWLGKILQHVNLENTLVVITSDHGSETAYHDEELEKIHDKNIQKRTYETGQIFKISHKIALKFPKPLLPLRKKLSGMYKNRSHDVVKQRMRPELEKIGKQKLSPYRRRLLEKSAWGTASLYDERVRVPLLFVGCGVPSGQIISQQVTSVNTLPTIAELVGLENEKIGHGISLVPLIKGKKLQELPVFIEYGANMPIFMADTVIGIRTSQYKYFRDKDDPKKKVHLFDLENDPLEENNIAEKMTEVVEKMENYLKNLHGDNRFDYEETDEKTDNAEAKKVEMELRKLGYV